MFILLDVVYIQDREYLAEFVACARNHCSIGSSKFSVSTFTGTGRSFMLFTDFCEGETRWLQCYF